MHDRACRSCSAWQRSPSPPPGPPSTRPRSASISRIRSVTRSRCDRVPLVRRRRSRRASPAPVLRFGCCSPPSGFASLLACAARREQRRAVHDRRAHREPRVRLSRARTTRVPARPAALAAEPVSWSSRRISTCSCSRPSLCYSTRSRAGTARTRATWPSSTRSRRSQPGSRSSRRRSRPRSPLAVVIVLSHRARAATPAARRQLVPVLVGRQGRAALLLGRARRSRRSRREAAVIGIGLGLLAALALPAGLPRDPAAGSPLARSRRRVARRVGRAGEPGGEPPGLGTRSGARWATRRSSSRAISPDGGAYVDARR